MKVKLLKKLRKRFVINKEYDGSSDKYLYVLRDLKYFDDYNQDYEFIQSSNNLQKLRKIRNRMILKTARLNYSKRIKIN